MTDPVNLPGGIRVAVNMEYWQERLYKSADQQDADARFFHDALKSSHLEGKMSAREMTFAKGGGLPTIVPISGAAGPQPPS